MKAHTERYKFSTFKFKSNIIVQGLLFSCTIISIGITIGIIFILISQSMLFFRDPAVRIQDFLFGTKWQPGIGNFGIAPLLNATIMTSLIAMLVAVPIGYFVAIYLSEYASHRIRAIVKPTLEILAGMPTVVYGYFAIGFVTPLLQNIFGNNIVEFYNMASAGLTMGLLILPLISSITEDALFAVPHSLRSAAYALGANKREIAFKIVTPAASSGIITAIIIGFSRAIGETMIVALASGAGPNLTFNPFHAAETISGYIVRISGGDISYNTTDYNSIFALGLLLFFFTLLLNIGSRFIARRVKNLTSES